MSAAEPDPDPLPAPPTADVAGTVSEMKRLLAQLEHGEATDPRSRDLMETLRVNTRMLQYIHDAHTRMAETLKRADRSDLVIQSADALNATFRQLRQSQEQLADRLGAERRRRPWAFVAGSLVVVAVSIPAFWWLLEHASARFDDHAQRMARAESTLVESSKSVERVEQGNAALRDLFDEGLAANRVLIHETRAQLAEIEALKTRMAAMEKEKVDAVSSALSGEGPGRGAGRRAPARAAAVGRDARRARRAERRDRAPRTGGRARTRPGRHDRFDRDADPEGTAGEDERGRAARARGSIRRTHECAAAGRDDSECGGRSARGNRGCRRGA
jgi:nitrogen fixation-related uncharacterized protein